MNDIEKKMEALKAEFLGKLEALQKEAEMQKKQEELKPWKPEVGESYFYISSNFEAMDKVKGTTSFETDRISNGNCFKTKKRAEQVAKKMQLLLRLEQLHDQLCPGYEPDWGNYGKKFLVYFNHAENRWNIGVSNAFELQCAAYFDTEENTEKAAEILNKEMKKSD